MIIVPIDENHVRLASATDAKFRAPDYSGSGLEAGVGDDAGLFTARLLTDNRTTVGAVDRRGKYNSVTPAAWKKQVMDTADSVRRRIARWDGAAR
jgi:hypothetical protein